MKKIIFSFSLILCLLGFLPITQAAETTTYFHLDPAGTPLLATNEAGKVIWKENHRPYGEKINNIAAASSNAIGYAGKPFDNATGLSYMGARYYNPALGRFMGIDPKGFNTSNIHSFNRYAYANNNPYKYVDPDGRSPIDIAFLAYDLGKLGVALYTGNGIGHAAVDVALSVVGVASPVPGAGQALKAARATHHVVDAGKAAEHVVEGARAGTNAALEGEKMLFRRGGNDSKALLQTQAQQAENIIGIHGVSVSTSSAAKAGQSVRCASCREVEAAGFKVKQTGKDPTHHTVELPKPVTSDVARTWNELFK